MDNALSVQQFLDRYTKASEKLQKRIFRTSTLAVTEAAHAFGTLSEELREAGDSWRAAGCSAARARCDGVCEKPLQQAASLARAADILISDQDCTVTEAVQEQFTEWLLAAAQATRGDHGTLSAHLFDELGQALQVLGELEGAGTNFEMAAELYRVEGCPGFAMLCFESCMECYVSLGDFEVAAEACHTLHQLGINHPSLPAQHPEQGIASQTAVTLVLLQIAARKPEQAQEALIELEQDSLSKDFYSLLCGLVQLAAGWDAFAVQAVMQEARIYLSSIQQQICDRVAQDMVTYRGACLNMHMLDKGLHA